MSQRDNKAYCAGKCGRRVPEGHEYCKRCTAKLQREWEKAGRPYETFARWLVMRLT